MGWTAPYKSKQEILDRVAPADGWDAEMGRVVFDMPRMAGSGIWGRLTITPKDGSPAYSTIAHIRTRFEGGAYAEGGLWDESCGFSDTDCPQDLFDAVPNPPQVLFVSGERAERSKAWRERCRIARAEESAKRSEVHLKRAGLKVGDRITFPEGWKPRCLTIREVTGARVVGVNDKGLPFKVRRKALLAATVQPA